jgi:hypothetical protein
MGSGYIPTRLSLADTLAAVMAKTGQTEEKCQDYICGEVARREVRFWAIIAGAAFEGWRLAVPGRLRRDDFDWEKSCPKEPWTIKPTYTEEILGHGRQRPQPIELLELSTEDLQSLGLLPRGDSEVPAEDVRTARA